MQTLLMLGLVAGSLSGFAQEPPIWERDFRRLDPAQWQWQDTAFEMVNGRLRVRVPTVPQKTQGTFGQDVPAVPADCYLQVLMGDMESSSATPWVGDARVRGKPLGTLLTGWNTFSLAHHAGRPLCLLFGQKGSPREATGPWVDYGRARIVKTPADGLVVSLVGKTDVARVGDRLLFTCYSSVPPTKPLVARVFLWPGFLDHRLTKSDRIELAGVQGNGMYTAEVEIDQDAVAFQSAGNKQRMMAMTTVNGVNSYYTLPFALDIQTANVLAPALAAAANMQVREDRQLWLDRTKGTNLALGRPVRLVPPPDYRLTTDPGDVHDLTDGKLSSNADDKLWFDRQAVGWYFGGGTSYLQVDLGQEEPVERLVIRCLGGTTGNFKFPAGFELFVSRDGKVYHAAAAMQKLMPNEAVQSDFRRYYFLEENGEKYQTRAYPFALNAQADARYILLKITGASDSIFTDELAILKAETKAADYNAAYRQPGLAIPMEGLIVRPRIAELALIRGIPAPQRFTINDMRSEAAKQEAASVVLEVPSGISVLGDHTPKTVQKGAARYRHYEFPAKKAGKKAPLIGPTLYLAVTKEDGLPAFIYGRSGGVDQFVTTLPIRVVALPEIPAFKRLHVSLSWMGETDSGAWPDFLNQWRKLGFNAVATFPRWWNPQAYEEHAKFVADARAAGYAVIMNDSCFHMMARRQPAGSEVYCQIPGKEHTMLCPSYRGDLYVKEMARVENCTRMSRPDYVFYDIECWHDAVTSAPQCTRCCEGWRQSGKSMPEFLFDCGTRQMADLKQAIRKGAAAAGIKTPLIGSYSREPLRPQYGIELFDRTYPDFLDMAQPSLYVAGRVRDVHDRIRGDHKLLKNKKIIPWLTAGTYGEFDSRKMEPMVLEALLNGAGGVTYYCFGDFTDSPLDFYYHAKALAELRPYEDLIVEGDVLEPKGSNRELTYSAIQRGGELLLLVGNYGNADPRTSYRIPFPAVSQVKDLRSGDLVGCATSSFTFEVPKGDIRLFYIKE